MKTTLKQLQANMKANNLQHVWISTPENIHYFSGFLSDPHERITALYVNLEDAILIVPNMEVNDAETASNLRVLGYLDTENAYEKFQNAHPFNQEDTLYIEDEHTTVKRHQLMQQYFGIQQFNSIDQMIKDMRNIKTEEEITILKQAAKYADEAVAIGVQHLKVGISESEVVQIIEQHMKKIEGISGMSFATMVLFGDHAASPHGTPGARKLKENEYVLFDLGVIYNGYCSDITRTVAFGTPKPFHQEIHAIVTEANERAIQMVKPGVKIKDIDAAARDYITEKGYGEYFPHRLGHGLGISVHEFPDISSANENELKPGMVFTIEPGIYYTNEVGVRVEDDILVTSTGYEILTGYKK